MLRKGKFKQTWAAIGILTWASVGSFSAFAAEPDSGAQKSDIMNVEMPVIEDQENSLFDFILDPQGLLCQTGAERYGGGTVEEGATLFFFNREGQYDFSSFSDKLTIKNKGVDSVTVTVSVSVIGLYEISLREDKDFIVGERSFYVAIVDNQGNEEPISADGEASVSFDMDEVGGDGYFEEYSFGLMGCCNPDADWKGVSDNPDIIITWRVEPKNSGGENQILEEQPGEQEEKPETAAETDSKVEESSSEQKGAVWEEPEASYPEETEPESEIVTETSTAETESIKELETETEENLGTEKSYPETVNPKSEVETESGSATEETGVL